MVSGVNAFKAIPLFLFCQIQYIWFYVRLLNDLDWSFVQADKYGTISFLSIVGIMDIITKTTYNRNHLIGFMVSVGYSLGWWNKDKAKCY